MKNNQAYIICVRSGNNLYYLGQRDGIMVNVIHAVFFHDELSAKYELNRMIEKYKNTDNTFLNDADNLFIKMVEINVLNE